MSRKISISRLVNIIFVVLVLIALYCSSLYNYLLFHTLAEIFSICIAFTVFMLGWNSSAYIKNTYLIQIAIAYLFIGFLDLLHTISYKGMIIFKDYDYYANQLWIATRYIESLTLAISFFLINTKKNLDKYFLFVAYCILTIFTMLLIFVWKLFPECFIEGVGQTAFKILSEYIICAILVSSITFLNKAKKSLDRKIYLYFLWSIIFTIVSELSFTLYVDNYGITNLIGHYFKIFSFFLIYKAVIEKGIREPYHMIFTELKANEQKLYEQNNLLRNQAIMDELSGLFNHRYLYQRLEEEIIRCDKLSYNLCVALFDLDNFKNVNDTYGHIIGDEIIKSVSRMIKNSIRCSDILGRYGGEEFLLVLPATVLKDAYEIAEKIRKEIEASTFINEIKVTISAGVAQHDVEKKASELVKFADNKLYEAKRGGRNKVVM